MNLRLLALSGIVVCAIALPLAVASAGQVGDGGRTVVRDLVRPAEPPAVRPPADPSAARPPADPSAARPSTGPSAVRPSAADDYKAPLAESGRSPLLLGLGLATAARCGPELTSPDGIEAQTCVLTQGEETWARTYYRNATGAVLDAALSFMGPGVRTVQLHCAVGAGDEPDSCETPRERTQGAPVDYTAVAEFARRGSGPLLLRTASNSGENTGS
ncbi:MULTISPECIES: hypothetical protein [Streptomyces]|uniref:Secreted protein n=1 Tax=Streptomyces sviceus (strain ATCC 29083 / DSM 924 / JCM 4929 / NBRC 13980 / NCIMB 11184 / NRRL 5439 / UC 5370) TaxID=463191 RepID=B5HUE7_STRX2|nr:MULTISPECIES: hypothetical protein [Streptomyces]EDY56452.1 conserved hypothetical protein [Streptomyces sviceus ATCC 29083]MYT06940.1 hypothetical protein [Streptomyces sp. SID5470]